MTTASTAGYPAFKDNRFLKRMMVMSAAVMLVSAIHPDKVFDWFLENATVGVCILLLIVTYRKMPFSDASYTLLFVFLSVHEWGAHYKYSDVPLGEWLKPVLHTNRNMYDRVIHFSFGLMMTYPIQEILMRSAGVTSRWRYLLPFETVLCLSAIYEMLEAGMAMILTPERGEEFVGMQGDIFDSQKDMFVAGVGSLMALIVIALIRRRRAARAAAEELAAYARTR